MTECFNCHIDEPLDLDTLHDGHILCLACGGECRCNHVSMTDPIELQLVTPWDAAAGMLTATVRELPTGLYEVLNVVDVILIPGDIVRAEDFQITDIVEQSPNWAWDVEYPPDWRFDPDRINERQRVYAEAVYCEVATSISLQVVSPSPALERAFRADPDVVDVEVIRDPNEPVTLQELMDEHYPPKRS